MNINAIMTIVVLVAILVYGFTLFNLHERVSALEKEVYIYLYPKIKEVAQQFTSKEGDS